MKCYKLTDQNMQTKNGFQWELGARKFVRGKLVPCENGLHAYSDPLLAVLLNPIHANFGKPRLFEARSAGKHISNNGIKEVFRSLTLVKEISLPVVTTEQRIKFAIFCALEVCHDVAFRKWAEKWLSGGDRSEMAARSAAAEARSAAAEAAEAARSAAEAARSAAEAARSAAAWAAAWAAAAWAAAWAARSAAEAARSAAEAAAKPLDLIALARKAVE